MHKILSIGHVLRPGRVGETSSILDSDLYGYVGKRAGDVSEKIPKIVESETVVGG